MRVLVDRARCKGYAVCIFEAPHVFEIGDDNIAVVIEDPATEDRRHEVETAVRQCPAGAISVLDETDETA